MDFVTKIFLSCLLSAITVYNVNERSLVLVASTKSDKSNFAIDRYESILQDVTCKEKSALTASENLDIPVNFLGETDNQELLLQSKSIIDDSAFLDNIELYSKLTNTLEAVVFPSEDTADEFNNKLKPNLQTEKIDNSNQIFHPYIENKEYAVSEDSKPQVDASAENATSQQLNESDPISLLRSEDFKKTASQPEDIPSFSEWTQKQLAEAEKKKTDQNGTMDRFAKSRGKFRNKNYASPDCGAKIVASNPEAVSSSSVLSSLKDEYMLNYCTNRIWFIVELCEPIQAKQFDLANFELFSSSPKEFSVFVSHRFPTREWSNVGKFTAQDSRDVQTFNLHPHLFGKFVKVEMHSHYGKEQFCPISWIGVYGTSEFEVLAKEDERNPLAEEDDGDPYDEELFQGQKRDSPKNLFSSATDAVLSIVKKATAPFMKTEINETETENGRHPSSCLEGSCLSPRYIIVCNNCSQQCYDSVFQFLSCRWPSLEILLENSFINRTLIHGDICTKLGLDFSSLRKGAPFPSNFLQISEQGVKYLTAMIKTDVVAALCNVLAVTHNRVVVNATLEGVQTLKNLTRKEFCEEGGPKSPAGISSSSLTQACNNDHDCRLHSSSSEFQFTAAADSNLSDFLKPSEHHPEKIEPTKTLTEDEMKMLSSSNVDRAGDGNVPSEEKSRTDQPRQNGQVAPTVAVPKGKEKGESIDSAGREERISSVGETKAEFQRDLESQGEGSSNGTNQDSTLESIISDLNAIGKAADSPHNSFASSSTNLPADSIFLRLANRIKNLEINMSLSSTYLEELSRRYRTQLELISKTLNLTIQKVEERSKAEEEKERKREKEILLIRMQLANLTRDLADFVREKNSWRPRASLISQHLLFISIEILLVWLVFNYWKRPPTAEINFEGRQEAIRKAASKKYKRRSSLDVKGNELPGRKARRPSDEALNIALSRTYQEEPFQVDKKRKRRKKESKCLLNGGGGGVHLKRKQSEVEISQTCLRESLATGKSGQNSEMVPYNPSTKKSIQVALDGFASAAAVSSPKSSPFNCLIPKTFQGHIASPIFMKTALAARNGRTTTTTTTPRTSLDDHQSSQEINFDRIRESKKDSKKEKKSSNSLKKYMKNFF